MLFAWSFVFALGIAVVSFFDFYSKKIYRKARPFLGNAQIIQLERRSINHAIEEANYSFSLVIHNNYKQHNDHCLT